MKFKKITFMALTALLTLSLGACSLIGQKHSQKNQGGTENSSRESQKNTSSDDIEELLEKAETANEDLTSMKMKVKLSITVDGSNKTQTMSGDLLYDKSTDELAKGHLVIDGKESGQESYQEAIMPGGEDKLLYTRSSKNGTWSKQEMGSGADYYVQPDYFKLMDGFYQMADDVTVKESGDEYIFKLSSKNADLLGLFGEEFKLELSGVTQADMDKKLEVRLDKKTLFLKDFKLGLSYKGEEGSLDVQTDTQYSDWNKVEEDEFKAPQ